MGEYLILQPNGKYAIWNSVVDDFTSLDMSAPQAVETLVLFSQSGYPGGSSAIALHAMQQVEHIAKSGISTYFSLDWNEACRYIVEQKKQSAQLIAKLGLPYSFQQQHSTVERLHYWVMHWMQRAQAAERKVEAMQLASIYQFKPEQGAYEKVMKWNAENGVGVLVRVQHNKNEAYTANTTSPAFLYQGRAVIHTSSSAAFIELESVTPALPG